jgi:hypothetical protein
MWICDCRWWWYRRLEELEHAMSSGAKIYELVGWGQLGRLSDMLFHRVWVVNAVFRPWKMPRRIKVTLPVEYVNTHGTSTRRRRRELGAIKNFFTGKGEHQLNVGLSLFGQCTGAAAVYTKPFPSDEHNFMVRVCQHSRTCRRSGRHEWS